MFFFYVHAATSSKKKLSISSDLQPIYIDGDKRLTLLLSRKLTIANIEVIDSPHQASSIIKIKKKKGFGSNPHFR